MNRDAALFAVRFRALAAGADGDHHTRVAMTGGVRLPGRAALLPFGVDRAARQSLRRLANRCGAED